MTQALLPPPRPIMSVELEQAMLGAILINNDAFGAVADIVRAKDFAEPIHQAIYEVMARQIREGHRVNPITLKASLPDHDLGGGLKLSAYLVRLASEAVTVAGARDYGRMVRDMYCARQFIGIADQLKAGADAGRSPSEALADAFKALEELRGEADEKAEAAISIGAAALALSAEIVEMRANKIKPATSTGLLAYDEALGGGYRKGRLYIEAGRPGSGKTVRALASARKIAKAGGGVMFFSLEIDRQEAAARIISSELARDRSPIAYRDIATGKLDDDQHERVIYAAEKMGEWPLILDCTGGLSMLQIESRARIAKERLAKRGIDLVACFVDYMGLVAPSGRYKGDPVREIGETVLNGKQTAQRLDMAMIMLSQLSRGVEGREDKRPTQSDLRGSGNIEEHADCVSFTYRPAYYLEKSTAYRSGDVNALAEFRMVEHILEMIIDKNRLGPPGLHRFWCNVANNDVDNLDERHN